MLLYLSWQQHESQHVIAAVTGQKPVISVASNILMSKCMQHVTPTCDNNVDFLASGPEESGCFLNLCAPGVFSLLICLKCKKLVSNKPADFVGSLCWRLYWKLSPGALRPPPPQPQAQDRFVSSTNHQTQFHENQWRTEKKLQPWAECTQRLLRGLVSFTFLLFL